MNIIVKCVVVGAIETNCFVAADSETLEGVVIDPGEEAGKILRVIDENKIKVKYIILTHGHYDHIGAVEEIKIKTGAKLLAHKEDNIFMEHPELNGSSLFGDGTDKVSADKYIAGDDIIRAGKMELKVIHTPGHTPGGICLLTGKHLFSGDTLFYGSIGRTDFPHANHEEMLKSLEKLMKLDDDVRVYPGHGEMTTIGFERRKNPFIER